MSVPVGLWRLSLSPRSKRARPGLGTTAFVLVPHGPRYRKGDQTQLRDDAVLAGEQADALRRGGYQFWLHVRGEPGGAATT